MRVEEGGGGGGGSGGPEEEGRGVHAYIHIPPSAVKLDEPLDSIKRIATV